MTTTNVTIKQKTRAEAASTRYGSESYPLLKAAPELVAALCAGEKSLAGLIMDIAAQVQVDLTDDRGAQRLWAWLVLLEPQVNAPAEALALGGFEPVAVVYAWDNYPDDIFRSMVDRFGGRPAVELAGREVVPLDSGDQRVLPGNSVQMTTRAQRVAFRPERFFVSAADTANGAADWLITDIRIGNRSQFSQAGSIPGDMFGTNAIDSFVSFETAQTVMDIVVIATYIGANPDGCVFRGALVGAVVKNGDLDDPEVEIAYASSLRGAIALAPELVRGQLAEAVG